MPARSLSTDRRALSEGMGVAVLVGFTVVVTATVGLNVLVVSDTETGPPQANFTYDYVQSSNALIVVHEEGDEFATGSIVVSGPIAEASWAAIAGVENETAVGPGSTIQLSARSAYGQPVTVTDEIVIYHGTGENRTEIDDWTGRPGGGVPPPAAADRPSAFVRAAPIAGAGGRSVEGT